MLTPTYAIRGSTRRSASRSTFGPARGWGSAGQEDAAAPVPRGGHHLAHIDISAPIQRNGDSDDEEWPPTPAPSRAASPRSSFSVDRSPSPSPPPRLLVGNRRAQPSSPLLQALESDSDSPLPSPRSAAPSPPPLVVPRSSPVPIPRARRSSSPSSSPRLPARSPSLLELSDESPPPSPRSAAPSPPPPAFLIPRSAPIPIPRQGSSSSSASSDLRASLLDPRARVGRYGAVNDGPPAPAPAPARRASNGITRENFADFITANTPGPITGASGTANAVSTVLNPSQTNAPASITNSRFGQNVASLSTGATATGFAANEITGAADIFGIGTELAAMRGRKEGALGRGLAANIRNPFAEPNDASVQEAEERSGAKRGVANIATNLADLGANQVPSAISSLSSLTHHGAATALGTAASSVAAVGGTAVNSAVALRSGYRGYRAATHWSNTSDLLSQDNEAAAPNKLTPNMRAAAEHQSGQMKSRTWKNVLGGLGAAAGAVGGGLLLAGMATPVGWGLAAAGGLVAGALGLYKLGRWAWKKYKTKNLGQDRERHATNLYDAMQHAPDHPERQSAERVLTARKINPALLHGANRAESIGYLKRKQESW